MSRSRWLVLSLAMLGVIGVLLLLPCAIEIRDEEGWVRSAHSLKHVGMALQSYHEVNGKLPPTVVTDADGNPLYSWRVLLLPFLEEQALYERFRRDEPWDSEHNRRFLEKTPRVYVPFWGGKDPPGMTRYQVFVGPGTAFEKPGPTWDDFPDGLAETILVVEAGEPVPWTKPADREYDPNKPLPALGAGYTKPVHFICTEVGRRPGFVAAFADGSVRFIRSDVREQTLRALITRNGGERVDVTELE